MSSGNRSYHIKILIPIKGTSHYNKVTKADSVNVLQRLYHYLGRKDVYLTA